MTAKDACKYIGLAIDAEIMQRWCQAAILWRRVGEIDSADFCEANAQFVAENNLRGIYPHNHRLSNAALKYR